MDEAVWKYVINSLSSLFCASEHIGHHGLHRINRFNPFATPLLANFVDFVFKTRVSHHHSPHVFIAHPLNQVQPLLLGTDKQGLHKEKDWSFLALLNASADDVIHFGSILGSCKHVDGSFGVKQVVLRRVCLFNDFLKTDDNLFVVLLLKMEAVGLRVNLVFLETFSERRRDFGPCVLGVANNSLNQFASFVSVSVLQSKFAAFNQVVVDCAVALRLFDVLHKVALTGVNDELFLQQIKSEWAYLIFLP